LFAARLAASIVGYDRVDHHARRGADAIQRERGIVPDRVPDGPVVQSERTTTMPSPSRIA